MEASISLHYDEQRSIATGIYTGNFTNLAIEILKYILEGSTDLITDIQIQSAAALPHLCTQDRLQLFPLPPFLSPSVAPVRLRPVHVALLAQVTLLHTSRCLTEWTCPHLLCGGVSVHSWTRMAGICDESQRVNYSYANVT